jgi:hypothetical protein
MRVLWRNLRGAEDRETLGAMAHSARSVVSLTVLLGVMTTRGLVAAPLAGAQGRTGPGLDGSWWIDVTFDGTPGVTNAHLATFVPGGAFVQSSALLSEPNASSGHGAWQRVGDNFALTFQSFSVDDQGAPIVYKVWATITLSPEGDRFTAPYRLAVTRRDGTVLQTGTGTASGTRLLVEPL